MSLQNDLYRYLTTPVDPMKYRFAVKQWAQVSGYSGSPSGLNRADLGEFVDWLREQSLAYPWNAEPKWMFTEASKMDPGEVFIHFTNEFPRRLLRGTTLKRLHLASWKDRKDQAQCPSNLRLPLGGAVFCFGFPAQYVVDLIAAGDLPEYGRNAIIGRTDQAVEVWHSGDEQYQLIFPACSDYDTVLVRDALDEGGQRLSDELNRFSR